MNFKYLLLLLDLEDFRIIWWNVKYSTNINYNYKT